MGILKHFNTSNDLGTHGFFNITEPELKFSFSIIFYGLFYINTANAAAMYEFNIDLKMMK
jgi:hypothetical protein